MKAIKGWLKRLKDKVNKDLEIIWGLRFISAGGLDHKEEEIL